MSRGGFDIDDFRDPDWEPEGEGHSRESFSFGREPSAGRDGSQGGASSKRRLEQLREAEARSDRINIHNSEQREASHVTPPRDGQEVLRNQEQQREKYRERDRTYSLRSSEIQTLTEVGKFRVISVEDVTKFGYVIDRSRSESDLRNLIQQGLVQRHGTTVLKKHSRQVLTLTKQGAHLIRSYGFVPEDQAIYSGLVKLKEAEHDSSLYRLFQRAAGEIESKGGRVLRVQLDYELKEQLYGKLGRAQSKHPNEAFHLKQAFAQQLHLPVVEGKVSFPDLRIEYANQHMEISRVDLELATGHYHAGHLAEKVRAGFQIYARSEDAAGLRRVRDDRGIMTSILSL